MPHLGSRCSISKANSTDIEDAPADAAAANIQDLLACTALPTADAESAHRQRQLRSPPTLTRPTTDANITPPIASTASSSRGDCSTQPCRV
eukprot:g10778.t1